jgi:hypothetical protein
MPQADGLARGVRRRSRRPRRWRLGRLRRAFAEKVEGTTETAFIATRRAPSAREADQRAPFFAAARKGGGDRSKGNIKLFYDDCG